MLRPHSGPDPSPTPPNERKPRPKHYGPGRPRVLDETKRREICALIAGGCGLREAAKYVHCSVNTIRREAERNPDFDDHLRRSEAYAQLSPLRAMQAAVGTHWRAAAWMLERAFPDRFARPEPSAFGARQARQLTNEVMSVVSSEISDPFKHDRLEKRIRGTFEYHIRSACDRHRNTRNLRRAMKFFDDTTANNDPLAQFGVTIPDFDTLMRPCSPSLVGRPAVSRAEPGQVAGDSPWRGRVRPKSSTTTTTASPSINTQHQPPADSSVSEKENLSSLTTRLERRFGITSDVDLDLADSTRQTTAAGRGSPPGVSLSSPNPALAATDGLQTTASSTLRMQSTPPPSNPNTP